MILPTRGFITILLLAHTMWADQVLLKGGERVIGKIAKKDGDKLTIKSDLLGKVTLPWAAVTEVSSDDPLVVVLDAGESVTGRIATRDGSVEVASEGAARTAKFAEINAIRDSAEQRNYERLLSPGWIDLWAGYVDFGLSGARGNADATTLTTALNATRVTRGDKTVAYFNQIYASALTASGSQVTAEALRGGVSYNKNATSKLFVNVFNDYEYDRFQNLDLRFVLGGGLGYNALKTERSQLDLLGGMAYNREAFSTPLTRNAAEAYWGNDLSYKLSTVTALRQGFRMFNNLTNTGAYRMNFDLGAVTTIQKWLSWQVSISDRYLSNPVTGRQKNDILYTTGVRVNFAR